MPHEQAGPNAESEAVKSRAASVSVVFNILSTAFKLVGAILTRSVSLFSEAIHSATDVAASVIALFSVRAAAAPADDEHPFGHGKIESLASFAESILLVLTMGFIYNEAIRRLIYGGSVQKLETGIGIMGISAAGSLLAGLYVRKVGQESGSLALQSNGQHLLVDCVTSGGVLVALAITRLTSWQSADPTLAIVLASWIGYNSVHLAYRAYQQLIDRRLPDDEIARLKALLDSNTAILSYHRLRTRLSGATRHVDVHLVVPNDWSVVQAHHVADDVEKSIRRDFVPAEVVVHVDPFDPARASPPKEK